MDRYIVERADGTKAAGWNNLRNPTWPDGSSSSGTLKAEDRIKRPGEDGEIYTVKEVLPKRKGAGTRVLSVSQPARVKSTGKWYSTTSYGPALIPAPDPVLGDAEYDFEALRIRDNPSVTDQLEAIWEQLNQDRLGGKDLVQKADDCLGKILTVKGTHPEPEG